jgi:hypothetical protein
MTPPLAVIVPTRGRPRSAARLTQAFIDTHALDAVPVFVADGDDPELPGYRKLLDEGEIPRLLVPEYGGPGGMCQALNYAARRYADLYETVGFMGDDHLPRTVGWDARMLDALDSLEPRIAYGNDLLQGAALPTAVFMQSRIIQAMGYMAPPVLHHLYLDNFWKSLGERLGGLRYLDDVVIEHLHPINGKADWDEGYRRVNAPEVDQSDRREWLLYESDGRFDRALAQVREEYGHDPRTAA